MCGRIGRAGPELGGLRYCPIGNFLRRLVVTQLNDRNKAVSKQAGVFKILEIWGSRCLRGIHQTLVIRFVTNSDKSDATVYYLRPKVTARAIRSARAWV